MNILEVLKSAGNNYALGAFSFFFFSTGSFLFIWWECLTRRRNVRLHGITTATTMLTVFGWHCWVWNTYWVPKGECLSVCRVKEAPEPALTAMQWCHAMVPFSSFSYRLVCFWGEKELTSCRTKQQPSIRETTACSQAKGTVAGWLVQSAKAKGHREEEELQLHPLLA